MNKFKRYGFLIFIIGIVLLLTSPFWVWQLKGKKDLDLMIVDKTVPDESYREHKGLMWLLNQQKYRKSDGGIYQENQDYVGYDPKEEKGSSVPESAEGYDAVYITDTYGVYEEDLDRENVSGSRSSKVYGGLEEEEIDSLKSMALNEGKTIIAEFNSMADPTDEKARRKFYSLFNLEWSGWIGRYFPDMTSEEVPEWVRSNYKEQYGKDYVFKGGGFVLVDRSDRLMILNGDDITDKGAIFSTTKKGEEEFGEDMSVAYSYWFDIVEAINPDEVLAEYSLSLTDKGKDKLKGINLPTSFPAVIHQENRQFETYYFSGDFADQPDVPNLYQTSGLPTWRKWTEHSGPDEETAFYWKAYAPMMDTILERIHRQKDEPKAKAQKAEVEDGIKLAGKVGSDYVQINQDGKWKDMTIKGVNMGIAKPGHFPGETAITKEEYLRWFKQIGAMNANSLRVYTIHPPEFYEAFYEYNQMAEKPLYLFHGVWVNEEIFLKTKDAFAKENTEEFQDEIKRTVDLIHGNADIPDRPGHASGQYKYDISPYVLGWVFGVEWDPEVVVSTNEKHKGMKDLKGEYLYTEKAQPFEVWISTMMDEAVSYETSTYQWQRPVSFTNWVTTDLLDHPYEPSEKEDMVSVDPNVIKATDQLHTGLFASYHIYPYYPDFLNYEPAYINYLDHRGEKNNYAGYLNDMKKHHTMPLVVAEFGVPGSRGLTHRNVDGLDQGHHSEKEQGEIDRRLFEDIIAENLAGGMVFTWQDEWFKRTWNTMDYDDPDRRPFWSNAQTNEQQFGVLSFDPGKNRTDVLHVDGRKEDWAFKGIKPAFQDGDHALYVSSDERYVYVRVDTDSVKDKDSYLLFDSIPDQGQSTIPGVDDVKTKGVDFVLHMKGDQSARLLVDSYYDSYYYHYGNLLEMIDKEPYADKKDNGVYHPIRLTLNKELTIQGKTLPFESYETGKMQFGTANPGDEDYDSLTDISVSPEGDMTEIRIPWQLLNIKDPSLKDAMGDMWKTGIEGKKKIDSINIGLYETDGKESYAYPALKDGFMDPAAFYRYSWKEWEEPTFHERLKDSYYILQEAYGKGGK